MNKYILEFRKVDLMVYISHLDLQRLFIRSFKRANISLKHSQGFNPHPAMSFAQPLSLGYEGLHEYIEFETNCEFNTDDIKNMMSEVMPIGISILNCSKYSGSKSLAATTNACKYDVIFPKVKIDVDSYLGQAEILAQKRQKKSKRLKEVNIKDKIRNIECTENKEDTILHLHLDGGSESNLSPELIIQSITKFLDVPVDRNDIKIIRKEIIFQTAK